jgi:G3E family GTPase
VVVDAKHIVQHLDETKPEGVENESVEQIAFADRVLLNKADLASEEELVVVERRIRGINAGVQILRTRLRPPDEANLDLEAILAPSEAFFWPPNANRNFLSLSDDEDEDEDEEDEDEDEEAGTALRLLSSISRSLSAWAAGSSSSPSWAFRPTRRDDSCDCDSCEPPLALPGVRLDALSGGS